MGLDGTKEPDETGAQPQPPTPEQPLDRALGFEPLGEPQPAAVPDRPPPPPVSTVASDADGSPAGHEPGDGKPKPLATQPPKAPRDVGETVEPAPARPRRRVDLPSLAALALLLLALLSPTEHRGQLEGPWASLATPGSATFLALPFATLLGCVMLFPLRAARRRLLEAGVGTLLVVFALVALAAALESGGFAAPDGCRRALTGGGGALVLLLAGAVGLPFGLAWLGAAPTSRVARVVVALGVLLAAFAYGGLHLAGVGAEAPLAALARSGVGAEALGDRLASWLALTPGVAALFAIVALLPSERHRYARILGLVLTASLVPPLAVLALFSATSQEWTQTLEPLKLTGLLAAGLLLATTSGGRCAAALTSRRRQPPAC